MWSANSHWSKYLIISVVLHVALLSIPVSMVVRQKLHVIEVSLATQNEPQPKPEAKKPAPKPPPPKPARLKERPPQAQRPDEPKDVKAQVVSPGENTVMQVAPGVGDATTGVAIAGAKIGTTGGTAIGGSMPGGTGTGSSYGYGGTVEGQFGRGEGPSFAYREMPEYPFAAKRLGKEGRVILQVTIDAKGKLEDVTVVEASERIFVEAAVDSIKKSRFLPGKKNGVPSRYKCKLAIRFGLER